MKKSQDLVEWLKQTGIQNDAVLKAIADVPRDRFVSQEMQDVAFEDEALSIECGQTISQPYVVARMTELLLGDRPLKKVLEIGTGSGYQAAILSHLVDEVYTVERYKTLLQQATQRFETLGYDNIHTLHADGFLGWDVYAPFDGIIVTAAAPELPASLLEQLADGGRMVIPVGTPYETQQLFLITRQGDEFEKQALDPVIFVPMLPGVTDE